MTTAAALLLIGRVIYGLFFLIAGIRNFAGFSDRMARATTNYGWKMPAPIVAIGFIMQLVGGVSVTLGLWPAWGAALLILFLIVATALFHNPLMFSGKDREPHTYFTLVNAALAGYGLMVIGLSL